MYYLIQGLAIGFSIAAPVGTIGFLCIQQTLKGGVLLGLVSGFGAATADMIYGILVALGLKVTQSILLTCKTPLTLLGGLFLCYLGLRKFFSKPFSITSEPKMHSLASAYITTFFLTLTNPATILDFTALFTGLNIDVTGYKESLGFVGGVFVGSAIWWFTLCLTVGFFRKKISTKILRYINYVAGLAIFMFGLYALRKTIG